MIDLTRPFNAICHYAPLDYNSPMAWSSIVKYSNFNLEDGLYKMVLNVNEKTTSDNVSITLKKDKILEIHYEMKPDEHTSFSSDILETLPNDADADTLDAIIENGKLIITLKQKETEKCDPKKISIKKEF